MKREEIRDSSPIKTGMGSMLLGSLHPGFSLSIFISIFLQLSQIEPALAQFRSHYSNLPSASGNNQGQTARSGGYANQQKGPVRAPAAVQASGGAYPEFKAGNYTVRWLKEQMPLKIWVGDGLAIDSVIEPKMGAPYANTDNTAQWPDLVAHLIETNKLSTLPRVEGYSPEHRIATIEGINMWKPFEKEGLFSFQFSEDPGEADIHVFFVHHFVNRLGMALFSNDIRGYTAKRSFPYKAIMQGQKVDFKPVVVLIKICDNQGRVMSKEKIRAAAAHEFGHALGIEGHSTNPQDLMSIYYGRGVLSPRDAATIRHLYKLTPDLVP